MRKLLFSSGQLLKQILFSRILVRIPVILKIFYKEFKDSHFFVLIAIEKKNYFCSYVALDGMQHTIYPMNNVTQKTYVHMSEYLVVDNFQQQQMQLFLRPPERGKRNESICHSNYAYFFIVAGIRTSRIKNMQFNVETLMHRNVTKIFQMEDGTWWCKNRQVVDIIAQNNRISFCGKSHLIRMARAIHTKQSEQCSVISEIRFRFDFAKN